MRAVRFDVSARGFVLARTLGRISDAPLYGGLSALALGEVDLARVREERQNFDPTGHYSRSDVFDLQVDRRRLSVADLGDEPVSLD